MLVPNSSAAVLALLLRGCAAAFRDCAAVAAALGRAPVEEVRAAGAAATAAAEGLAPPPQAGPPAEAGVFFAATLAHPLD